MFPFLGSTRSVWVRNQQSKQWLTAWLIWSRIDVKIDAYTYTWQVCKSGRRDSAKDAYYCKATQCSPHTADMRRWISRVPAPSATKKRTTPLCSSLLPAFPMLDEHTLHFAHLQSNKETAVWTCVFSLCMSPTLQMVVSIRSNSVTIFCEEWVLRWVFGFHLTVPHTCESGTFRHYSIFHV